MDDITHHTWDLWYPQAAARGLPFAWGRLRATEVLLVHAAPEVLDVEVREDDGRLVARGVGLRRTDDTPIARLTCSKEGITRADLWPGQEDLSRPVILAGGEVGILQAWWNARDKQEWRWSVEFYNHR